MNTNCNESEGEMRKINVKNPHLDVMNDDFLYHLSLGKTSHDLEAMFGDVKFICMGGTAKRMEIFANYLMEILDYKLPVGSTLDDLTKLSNRFSMYKVGPVLSISHGMGISSIGILLHEIIKLAHYAKMKDPIFFRTGTSGGVGHKGGVVVISDKAVDELGNYYYEVPILGKKVKLPALFDQSLIEELKQCVDPKNSYETVVGTTMCAVDFYEGQGRIDGAFCDYTENDKMNYLKKLKESGVANIEMESVPFAAFTHRAGIRAADVCVSFLDRLEGDQVIVSKEDYEEWQLRPQKLVAEFIKKSLEKSKH